jgi:hypothetical protein
MRACIGVEQRIRVLICIRVQICVRVHMYVHMDMLAWVYACVCISVYIYT